jgi:hypothetical protein
MPSLLICQAYDNDEPDTNNSRLLYSLLPWPYSYNFSLDPNTGLLTSLGPLDREAIDPALKGLIVLTVHVTDCGVPPLSTEVNVTITVEVRLGSAGYWASCGHPTGVQLPCPGTHPLLCHSQHGGREGWAT